jgi:Ca-activated chloride channel family protein
MNPLNRYITGLGQEHFKIFENKIEQDIAHFSNHESPVSLGFVLDVSGSMQINILSARSSIIRFLEQGGSESEDEYFLVTFNNQAALTEDFTLAQNQIQNQIALTHPKGQTALFDAVCFSLDKIQDAHNQKKALIVVTDGEENFSRYSFGKLRDFAKELDFQIYVIGQPGPLGTGLRNIGKMASLTGGRAFFPTNFKQLKYFVGLIQAELHNQYVIATGPPTETTKGSGETQKSSWICRRAHPS